MIKCQGLRTEGGPAYETAAGAAQRDAAALLNLSSKSPAGAAAWKHTSPSTLKHEGSSEPISPPQSGHFGERVQHRPCTQERGQRPERVFSAAAGKMHGNLSKTATRTRLSKRPSSQPSILTGVCSLAHLRCLDRRLVRIPVGGPPSQLTPGRWPPHRRRDTTRTCVGWSNRAP